MWNENMKKLIALLWLACFSINAATDIEAYLSINSYLTMKLSPDGNSIAAVTFDGEEYGVAYFDAGTFEVTNAIKLKYPDVIGDVTWINNKRVLISVQRYNYKHNALYKNTELLSIPADRNKGEFIFGYRARVDDFNSTQGTAIASKHRNIGKAWVDVVDLLPQEDDYIIVAATPTTGSRDADTRIYKLNVVNGNISPITSVPRPYARVFSDGQGNLIGASAYNKDYQTEVLLYDKNNDTWRVESSLKQAKDFQFAYYDHARRRIAFLARYNNDKRGLHSFGLENKDVIALYQDEQVDISYIQSLAMKQHPYAIVLDKGKRTYLPINPSSSVTQMFGAMVNGFKGHNINITGMDAAGKRTLFYLESDVKQKTYYLFDQERGKPALIAKSTHKLEGKTFSPKIPFEHNHAEQFVSGYLTLPVDAGEKKAPIIVLVNPGPESYRFTWRFNRFVQLLAQEGYAVIQPNLPGVRGYGQAFDYIGEQNWSTKQSDLLASIVTKLSEQYSIDASNSCVIGEKFGGFVAALASINRPDVFKCSVAKEGYFDIPDYKDGRPGEKFVHTDALNELQYGSDEAIKDAALAGLISQAKRPIMFIHGEYDKRQTFSEVESFVEELKKKGIDSRIFGLPRTSRVEEKLKAIIEAQESVFDFLEAHIK